MRDSLKWHVIESVLQGVIAFFLICMLRKVPNGCPSLVWAAMIWSIPWALGNFTSLRIHAKQRDKMEISRAQVQAIIVATISFTMIFLVILKMPSWKNSVKMATVSFVAAMFIDKMLRKLES